MNAHVYNVFFIRIHYRRIRNKTSLNSKISTEPG